MVFISFAGETLREPLRAQQTGSLFVNNLLYCSLCPLILKPVKI